MQVETDKITIGGRICHMRGRIFNMGGANAPFGPLVMRVIHKNINTYIGYIYI